MSWRVKWLAQWIDGQSFVSTSFSRAILCIDCQAIKYELRMGIFQGAGRGWLLNDMNLRGWEHVWRFSGAYPTGAKRREAMTSSIQKTFQEKQRNCTSQAVTWPPAFLNWRPGGKLRLWHLTTSWISDSVTVSIRLAKMDAIQITYCSDSICKVTMRHPRFPHLSEIDWSLSGLKFFRWHKRIWCEVRISDFIWVQHGCFFLQFEINALDLDRVEFSILLFSWGPPFLNGPDKAISWCSGGKLRFLERNMFNLLLLFTPVNCK